MNDKKILENRMKQIKQKILNDDIMKRSINDNDSFVYDKNTNWESDLGIKIVDLYKKLSNLVEKIR